VLKINAIYSTVCIYLERSRGKDVTRGIKFRIGAGCEEETDEKDGRKNVSRSVDLRDVETRAKRKRNN